MPSIYYMNPPPNPFWDFIANIEDHPVVTGWQPRRHGRPWPGQQQQQEEQQQQQQQAPQPAAETEKEKSAPAESSEKGKSKEKQAYVEDPPEVDPTTVKPATSSSAPPPQPPRPEHPFHGRGPFPFPFGEGNEGSEGPYRRHGCRGRGGFRGQHGPPPFMMGPHGPWWARRGPPGPHGHPEGGFGPHQHRGGRGGMCGRGRRPGSPSQDRPRSPPNFNLGEFLNNLGSRLGVDLSGAAEAIGGATDRFTGPRNNNETDFEPRADIFDTPSAYLVHLSLPGAKKEDIGVDWDGENSVLRIAGVVHRPGVDETLLSQLVVDGRKRETGVFERAVRLGTKRDPASVDVAGITAKMTDGVLVVKVPKVEAKHERREVPIASSSGAPSPDRYESERNVEEKKNKTQQDLLFDADEEMHDAPVTSLPHRTPAPETTVEQDAKQKEVDEKERQQEQEQEMRDDRSETIDHEPPQYEVEEFKDDAASDWEKDGSDDEGDFVKITVN